MTQKQKLLAIYNWLYHNNDFPDFLCEDLYEFYMDEMPYGIANGDDGDSGEFIAERVTKNEVKDYYRDDMINVLGVDIFPGIS